MSPSGDDVRRQLDRLLASAGFANAGRMSRFLRFVVEKSLAGEGERLKEYVIGIEVFDRDPSYDPRLDSIVRVEAARLRAKLAEYYAGEGRGDAVVLSLPKGGYSPIAKIEDWSASVNGTAALAPPTTRSGETPVRSLRSMRLWALGALLVAGAAAAAIVAWSPGLMPVGPVRIAVLPFTPDAIDADTTALAQRVTEGVTAALVRDGRFSVVASSAARAEYSVARRPRDVAATLDADVLIEARISSDGQRVRVEARTTNGKTEQKLWVRSFASAASDTDPLEQEIAGAIADALISLEDVRADGGQ
jgi:TolB-like protein